MGDTMSVRLEKNQELKKHVGAIHSSSQMTLIQRKLFNALLYNAYDDLLKKNEYQIGISSLCQLIGFNSNNQKVIKSALIDLLSIVIEWNVIKETSLDKAEIWNASSIIADASIENGICTYSYSNRMRELLYSPAVYGKLNMKVLTKFQSLYGLALYENCIRFQNIKHTPWMTLEIFRKLMGVENDSYPIFRDLKRRVIDSAVKEVNDISSIAVTPEYTRQNRNVVTIRFTIDQKSKVQSFVNNSSGTEIKGEKRGLENKLKFSYGLSKTQCENVLCNFQPAYIESKMSMIENSSTYKKGKIINLARYLISALENDYQVPKSSKDLIEENNIEVMKQIELDLYNRKQEEMKNNAYAKYIGCELQRITELCSSLEQEKMMEGFLTFLQKLPLKSPLKFFHEKGLNDKRVIVYYKEFIKECYPEIMRKIKTEEEFFNSVYH